MNELRNTGIIYIECDCKYKFSFIFRFRHTLEYLGYSAARASSTSVGYFCRILAEFALEYRTTREKIIEGREKKALARERKRTRGKLIVDVSDDF